MEKLKMHSVNKVDENIEKIGALFPNALTEVIKGYREDGSAIIEPAIDFDVLRQELSSFVVEGPEERYQFTWPDKKKSILLANAPIAKTLRPCHEESVDFEKTENLYIEGDNLDVLKLLKETYLGQVKMIYIDPPYNTGNDFVYEDDFAQDTDEYLANSGQYDEEGNRLVQNMESNGRFHTDWLNMIYPRLKLAKDLLTDDGVILINMDENEISNLQKICYEIFGNANELGTIVWDKRNPKGDAKGISAQHEYIVLFARNKEFLTTRHPIIRPKKNANKMLTKATQLLNRSSSLVEANSDYAKWVNSQTDLSGGEKAYNRIDENGNVYRPVSMAWPNKKKAPDDYFIPLIHPVTGKSCPIPERGWRNPSATMQDLIKKGMILFGKDETTQPNRKYLLKDNMFENIPSLLYYGGSDDDLLKELGIPFDTPKVVDIVAEHVLSFTSSDDIVLDFFSGSATTAHAIMQLNSEHRSNRKFIMVQLPEETDEKSEALKAGYKNICEIGKERIHSAGKKILEEHPEAADKLDIGFRVLKVDTTNMQDVYYNPAQYEQDKMLLFADNIKPDRTPEDLLFQVMLDLGVLLSSKIEETIIGGKMVFNVAEGYLLACFDSNVTSEVITEIARKQPYYAVFRDSSMASDSVATNFEQIFETYSPTTVRKVL
ncbi:MAG: site-specific DNA-methyltransferase [Firmicutes bacterium HGW-Firmicutes-15]|nr:MAG: site-specific DNA-methyltransferase [Firmicutes bacterium HGW-Firmicutes-15]